LLKSDIVTAREMTLLLVRRWFSRVLGGIIDQGCFSGTNFLLNILLARWLLPEVYGEFVVVFSFLLLLIVIHNALILEPINVVGPKAFRDKSRNYLVGVTVFHTLLVAVYSLLIFGVIVIGTSISPELHLVLKAMACMAPLILTLWFLRRFCYYLLVPSMALWGSISYAIITVIGLVFLHRSKGLVAADGMWVSGIAAGVGCSILIAALFFARNRVFSCHGMLCEKNKIMLRNDFCRVLIEHWHYGKWLLAGSLLGWINTGLYAPLLGAVLGLREAAALRAIENLFLPMQQMLTAFAMVALPWFARQYADKKCDLGATTIKLAGCTVGGAVLYTIIMIVLGPLLMMVLYGNAYYAGFSAAIPIMGAAIMIRAIGDVGVGCTVRVLGRTRWLFGATLAATIVTLVFGVWALISFGIYGAMGVRAMSGAVYAVVLFVLSKSSIWGIKYGAEEREVA